MDKASRRRRLAPVHPSGAQLRAARALAGITAERLAELAGVSLNTVKRGEAAPGPLPITAANASAIVRAVESLGVTFLAADESGGEGVRRL